MTDLSKVSPTRDNVVVRMDPDEGKSEAGIWYADQAVVKARWGTVLAAGPDTDLEPGDRVYFRSKPDEAFGPWDEETQTALCSADKFLWAKEVRE